MEIWLKAHKIDFLTMGGIAPLDPGKGGKPHKIDFFLKKRARLFIYMGIWVGTVPRKKIEMIR